MNALKLKARIVLSQKTLTTISDEIGVSTPTLRKRLSGETEFNVNEILNLKKSLNLDKEEILDIFFDEDVS